MYKCELKIPSEDLSDHFTGFNYEPTCVLTPLKLKVCCDSRKDKCPYAMFVSIDTDYMNVAQCFCGWAMRKRRD